MTAAKSPTRDPVQIFCANFPSHKDLTVYPSKNKEGIVWPKKFDNNIQLRISRYSLEVLNCLTSGRETTDEMKRLAVAILEFYGPSPVERFCRPDMIAEALIETNLIEKDLAALTREVAGSVNEWLKLAIAASLDLVPELAAFEGKAEYTLFDGAIRWAPVRWTASEWSSKNNRSASSIS